VNDLNDFSAGGGRPRHVRLALWPVRRALGILLRPLLQRQVQVQERLEAAEERIKHTLEAHHLEIQSVMAFGWDHAALVRRVAVLEDRVETLMGRLEAQGGQEHAESKAKVA